MRVCVCASNIIKHYLRGLKGSSSQGRPEVNIIALNLPQSKIIN